MYKSYFEARGYSMVVIRGGEEGLERAIAQGPSLVTFRTFETTRGTNNHSPVIIFTYNNRCVFGEQPKIKSAVMSSDVFREIEDSLS